MKIIFFSMLLLLSWYESIFAQKLEIEQINSTCYVYTTYNEYAGNLVPSNSMYILTDSGAILIDTPWDSTLVIPLLDSIRIRHNKEVLFCIATHSHADRTVGFGVLNRLGIKTFSTDFTRTLCIQNQDQVSAFTCPEDTVFRFPNLTMQVFYPGRGHAPDNIVIYLPEYKLLYGGCLIKSLETNGIGNTSDANLPEWIKSVKNVIEKFPEAEIVIPGHYRYGNAALLPHTINIVETELRKKGQ